MQHRLPEYIAEGQMMMALLKIPFFTVPLLVIVIVKYLIPVFGYWLAIRKWPQRDMLLQFVFLFILGAMIPAMLVTTYQAVAMVVKDLTLAEAWMEYLRPYREGYIAPLLLRWLVLTVPSGICMIFFFGIKPIRRKSFGSKLLLMIAFVPVSILISLVLLFVVLLVFTLLGDVFGYFESLYSEVAFRLY